MLRADPACSTVRLSAPGIFSARPKRRDRSVSRVSRAARMIWYLKHAVGLGQLMHNDEDLAAIGELAQFGIKGDLLTDDEFLC
jgi:hypothetical protein